MDLPRLVQSEGKGQQVYWYLFSDDVDSDGDAVLIEGGEAGSMSQDCRTK